MTRFASLSSSSDRVRGQLQARLYYAREKNREARKNALGPELISNGDLLTADGWTVTGEAVLNVGSADIISTGAYSSLDRIVGALEVNKFYQLSVEITSYTSGTLKLDGPFGDNIEIGAAVGVFTNRFLALEDFVGNVLRFARNNPPTDLTITNISLRKVG